MIDAYHQAVADKRVLMTRAWREARLAVLDRDGWRCQIQGPHCLGRANAVDHIVPRSEGGEVFDPANLRASCRPCNSQSGARLTNDRRRARSLGHVSRAW